MASGAVPVKSPLRASIAGQINKTLPAAHWISTYERQYLTGDITAGVITAIMLAPQAMAYAMLAGLPPQTGLYASIVPLILYAGFGSSRTLAVGPVALVSLITADALGSIAGQGTEAYINAALALAIMVGLMNLALGFLRAGFLVNFMSHPVISGFTSAAAIVIGFSQLKHVLGVDLPRSHNIIEIVGNAAGMFSEFKWMTIGIAAAGVVFLVVSNGWLNGYLKSRGLSEERAIQISRTGPLFLVLASTIAVWALALAATHGVAIVGDIPSGLPPISVPPFEPGLWRALAPTAALITLIGFLESVSVAKALAAKRRQKIDPNREFVGLGFANIGAAFTGGYPVTGGFSRSSVNFQAGAATPLASIITAGLIALTVLFLTPIFYFLPKAVLAAIIITAVAGLVDWRMPKRLWRYDRAEAMSVIVTFLAVLTFGVEIGIVAGVVFSILVFLGKTAKPHIAIIGRVGTSEHFRNILRHEVHTDPKILMMRIDENLYFANSNYFEEQILHAMANHQSAENVVINCNAINMIDGSAMEALEALVENLREGGVTLHLAEVKGPVMDRLLKTDFLDRLKPGKVFLSAYDAMIELESQLNANSDAVK
ncbi:MAG: solute carrier family 26 protein [Marinicaulis sp.]|nr:solute carrier family 26 protein [Marinicaulis sp.]NNL87675.1 solute carrier family 26 protein [Marinicaulis sp.]